MLALLVKELLTSVIHVASNCQNTTAPLTSTKRSEKLPVLSTKKERLPKITMLISGRMIDQPKPIQVCL